MRDNQSGFDPLIQREREAARKDPRQLDLPFRMTLGEHAYNLGRQARRDHPENYDQNGKPTFEPHITPGPK